MARRLRIVDRPEGYRAHNVPTPLLGGLAVAAATAVAVVWTLPADSAGTAGLWALLAGALVVLVAGVLDDVRRLSPRHKLAWQIAATTGAGLCLALLGVRLDFYLQWPPAPIIALTVLWIVAITNAMNFLDNMNGLCAGLGALAAAALATINLRTEEGAVAVVAAGLCGACLGFLPYNWPRARVFLGDTGAMFIGFTLAALSVMGVYTRGAANPTLAVYSPLLVLAVPMLDMILVTLLRRRAGHPPWLGDRRHISHRLVRRGMRPATAVATLWMAAAASGLGAVLLPAVGATEAPLLILLVACALGALAAAAGNQGLAVDDSEREAKQE
jgi:UDP-GlcNAc:undecaprenyl-phosphate GlcNAc-1-phosphate transferase